MPPRPATPISLFSARARTYTGPSAYEESEYHYLDRSARAYAVEVRSTLDEWCCALPEYARTSLGNSFASSRTPVHRGALLELYLHEMFRRLDLEIDLDIGREDPAHRRPDFLLEPDGARTWVEATAVLGADVFAEYARRRAQQLYDLLNRCRDRRFLLHVAIEEVGSATLGRRQVLDPLERWLAGRDPVELRQANDRGDEPPECRLTSGGWVIAIEATPVRADMPLRPDERLVGSSLEGFATLDDARPLRGSLKHKATHYGELDAPYVVAALCVGTFVTDHDIEAALLGDIAYARDPQGIGLMRARQPNGLWHGPGKPVNTRVSAVATFPQLSAASIAAVEPTVWKNPWAECPLGLELPWRQKEIAPDGGITTHDATRTAAEVLGLPPDWPGSDL